VFSIKDIAALASRLFVPFFAAALVVEGFWAEVVNELPYESELAALALRFLFFTTFLYIAFVAFVDPFVVWLDGLLPETDLVSIMLLVGFVCVAVGLYGLSFAVPDLPKSPLHLFWHLGFLSYGSSLIIHSGRV
jgi:hypothetical protein